MYFANIHAYLNYANVIWASTHKTKLKNVQSKQKHAFRITFNHSKPSSSEPPFQSVQCKAKILRISSENYLVYRAMLKPQISYL